MTGVPDTAHDDGLRTAVRRMLWLAGLLLGLWFLSWIVADEAKADGLGVHVPIVDQIVQPVVPAVDKVLKPVGKVVQGLEKGPVQDLLKPVGKIVDALPAPVPGLVKPILKPVGSVGDTIGGLTPDPGSLLPTTPAPTAPKKVKPAHRALTATSAVPAESVAAKESSATTAVGHDFRIPAAAKDQQPKTVLLNQSAHNPTGNAPLSGRPGTPLEPSPSPATTVGAAGSVPAVVVHDAAPDFVEPVRLAPPHGVFAPLWRSLKPGTSPG